MRASHEYRFVPFEHFSRRGVSRTAEYDLRGRSEAWRKHRPVFLKAGESCDYVVQHVLPGAGAIDYGERHGPYALWVYARAQEDTQLEASLYGNDALGVSVPASRSAGWYGLGEAALISRMPLLKVTCAGPGEIECRLLLVTDYLSLQPKGGRDDVETEVYGFCRRDLGRSSIDPDVVTVFEESDVAATYECGSRGLAPGDKLILRHWGRYRSSLQDSDPANPFFLEPRFPDGTRWDVFVPGEAWLPHSREQWIVCTLRNGSLRPSDEVRFSVKRFKADVARDGVFYRNDPDHWFTPLAPLTFLVDVADRGQPLPLHEENTHPFSVVNAEPDGLHAVAVPSPDAPGEHRLTGVVVDRYNHPLEKVEIRPERVVLSGNEREIEVGEAKYGFTTRVHGANRTRNPLGQRPFWGDLHGHSLLSDGLGRTDEYYPYARDVAGLDFCAIAEHVCYLTDTDLEYVAALAAEHLQEGRFVTLFGFEWAGDGGHRCLYTDGEWLPPIRGMTPETGTLQAVWDILDRSQARHLVSAHSLLGMPAMRRYADSHNPKYERYVEAYTRGGGSEFRGNPLLCSETMKGQAGLSYRELLAKGVKVGFAGASDNHEAMPGLTVKNWDRRNVGGLVGVWTEELTRSGVFSALYDRRCFATTGQKASLWIEVNGTPMGSECGFSKEKNVVGCHARATAPIRTLDIIRDGEAVHTCRDLPAECAVDFEDTLRDGPAQYYYFRIIQKDGNWAWSSPVFVG